MSPVGRIRAAGRDREPARDPLLRSGPGRLWLRTSTWLLAYLPDRSRSRRPPVRLHAGAAVPSPVLRAAVVLIGLICASTVVTGPPGWVITIGLLIGAFLAPGTMVTGVLVIAFGLLMVFDPEPASGWRTPLLVALLPAMMQLAAIAAQASWSARIELRVLELPLRRYLGIQVVAQLLTLAGAMVAGLGWVLPQVMALAAVAVLALVVVWLPTLGPARPPRDY